MGAGVGQEMRRSNVTVISNVDTDVADTELQVDILTKVLEDLKPLDQVSEPLENLEEEIGKAEFGRNAQLSNVERDLDAIKMTFHTLEQNRAEYVLFVEKAREELNHHMEKERLKLAGRHSLSNKHASIVAFIALVVIGLLSAFAIEANAARYIGLALSIAVVISALVWAVLIKEPHALRK